MNTYTYGSVGVKNAGYEGTATFDSKKYNSVRTAGTIGAESRLTGRASFEGMLIEKFFATQTTHKSMQLSNVEGLS